MATAVPITSEHVFQAQIDPNQKLNPSVPAGVRVGGSAPLSHHSGGCNEKGISDFLNSQGYPPGLIQQCLNTMQKFPVRYFICDDSGSMMTADGNKMTPDHSRPGHASHHKCTRWEELCATVRYHTLLAQASGSFCEFKFLNGPTVEFPKDVAGDGLAVLERTLNGSPGGGTPLCRAISEIEVQISAVADTLRRSGQQAVITILTDGEASDGDLATAMRPLQNLPVWVVVRLHTDQESVVNYWNDIDSELEVPMDVLDDIVSEAKEVKNHNKFLNYGEPLHRMREWGMHFKELDMLDEQVFTIEQVHKMLTIILGDNLAASLPLASLHHDLPAYVVAAKRIFEDPRVPKIHNVLTKQPGTWINPNEITRKYKSNKCIVS